MKIEKRYVWFKNSFLLILLFYFDYNLFRIFSIKENISDSNVYKIVEKRKFRCGDEVGSLW